jgi:hypothetical protein
MNGLAGYFDKRGAKAIRNMTLGQYEEVDVYYTTPTWLRVTLGLVSFAGGVAGAYHGYKRHDSVWGGIGWYFLGSIFWPISIPVAFAQGYGQPK